MILGIDEVGRGPWAGPLVVGAVVLGGAQIDGLTDSKKLTKKRREMLYEEIYAQATAIGLGWVSAAEIDEIGLSTALQLASRRAVREIKAPFHEVIIDGTINLLKDTPLERYVTTMPKADLLVPSVSAASIVAKVARDRYMSEQDAVYQGYGFGAHVGYGTATHRRSIDKLGVTPLHRLSFAPLTKYRTSNNPPDEKSTPTSAVSSTVTSKKKGDVAEDQAENYLVCRGHNVLARNWKTKYCEIDIVSQKDDVLYFTEVKYRRQANQGDGLAAITAKKLNQMRYAARFYTHSYKITDTSLMVSAIALSGTPPVVEEYIERI